jgi:hypothetical protein
MYISTDGTVGRSPVLWWELCHVTLLKVIGSILLEATILFLPDISWPCDLFINSEGRQLSIGMYHSGR